ncbi:hypothetical protein BJV78DRAFT_318592 [Lactifluus subvellereus]|nr:hypothetical protein BJV78DRAFT_318592 [Lactifluus subvellereus]
MTVTVTATVPAPSPAAATPAPCHRHRCRASAVTVTTAVPAPSRGTPSAYKRELGRFFFLVISFLTDKSPSSQVHDALPPHRQHPRSQMRGGLVGGFAPMTSSFPHCRAATLPRPQARAGLLSYAPPLRRHHGCCHASSVTTAAPAQSLTHHDH